MQGELIMFAMIAEFIRSGASQFTLKDWVSMVLALPCMWVIIVGLYAIWPE